jgi:hypothetical protein
MNLLLVIVIREALASADGAATDQTRKTGR